VALPDFKSGGRREQRRRWVRFPYTSAIMRTRGYTIQRDPLFFSHGPIDGVGLSKESAAGSISGACSDEIEPPLTGLTGNSWPFRTLRTSPRSGVLLGASRYRADPLRLYRPTAFRSAVLGPTLSSLSAHSRSIGGIASTRRRTPVGSRAAGPWTATTVVLLARVARFLGADDLIGPQASRKRSQG
jgi:hypothetical protein